jgi:hypothetical protein
MRTDVATCSRRNKLAGTAVSRTDPQQQVRGVMHGADAEVGRRSSTWVRGRLEAHMCPDVLARDPFSKPRSYTAMVVKLDFFNTMIFLILRRPKSPGHPTGLPITLGTKYREPRTEPKLRRTEPKNTETEKFGSCSVPVSQEPNLPR